jgi:hypothetical protein
MHCAKNASRAQPRIGSSLAGSHRGFSSRAAKRESDQSATRFQLSISDWQSGKTGIISHDHTRRQMNSKQQLGAIGLISAARRSRRGGVVAIG